MAKRKFWLGMLVMVLAFGMTTTGCDTGGGEQQPPTPLQQAINWANEDVRRWTVADNEPTLTDIPFSGIVPGSNPPWCADDFIRDPGTTFIQFVEDALTDAWYATYIHTPALWNAAKWKEIIGNAFDQNVSYFSAGELPLIIS